MIKQLKKIIPLIVILSLVMSRPAMSSLDQCFHESGRYFNIDPVLLKSIAIVESNLNAEAIGQNKDSKGNISSKDYGIMQINEIHVPQLINSGIITSTKDLLNSPCLNIKIGSWILFKHFSRCGVNWECLGTYNAGFSAKNLKKRDEYVIRVYSVYVKNSH